MDSDNTFKGWTEGTSWLHVGPDGTEYVYLNIPKNASSWMKHQFNGEEFNYLTTSYSKVTFVILLRDPIDRWISGAAQSLYGCSPESDRFFLNVGYNSIFDKLALDEHTQCQHMFLRHKLYENHNVVWFKCDADLKTNWEHWAKDKITPRIPGADGYMDTANPFNISKLGAANQFPGWHNKSKTVVGWTQQQIKDTLVDHLNTCPQHLDRLKAYCRMDQDLIDSVEFYETR